MEFIEFVQKYWKILSALAALIFLSGGITYVAEDFRAMNRKMSTMQIQMAQQNQAIIDLVIMVQWVRDNQINLNK